MHPKNQMDQAVNIRLTRPVSRLSTMPSLKHLCRFAIVSSLAVAEVDAMVDRLPLPDHLLDYLKQPKYIAHVPPLVQNK